MQLKYFNIFSICLIDSFKLWTFLSSTWEPPADKTWDRRWSTADPHHIYVFSFFPIFFGLLLTKSIAYFHFAEQMIWQFISIKVDLKLCLIRPCIFISFCLCLSFCLSFRTLIDENECERRDAINMKRGGNEKTSWLAYLNKVHTNLSVDLFINEGSSISSQILYK